MSTKRVLRSLMLLAFCIAIDSATAGGTLQLQDCRLQSAVVSGSVAARCGFFTVPENRQQPGGPQVQLHIAVVPSLRLEPAADPLFVISGGPGQGASDFYLSISPALARVRRDRDIVIVDQRGTGRSHRMDCEFPDDDFTLVDPQRLRDVTRSCLEKLRGDPRYYTTSIAVRDLDDVRAALGYQSISLYGVSYGTRVAQHYMRRYPQRVRVAVLDGVVPPQLALGPDVAVDAQRALDNAFSRCGSDEQCQRAFPNIAATFQALRGRLESHPLALQVPDPVSAEPAQTTFGLPQLTGAIRLLSYSDETLSTLPLLIHEAQVAEQPQGLAAQYLMVKRSTDAQFAYGMHFAVVCSEDAPRWSTQDVAADALARTYMGDSFMSGMKTICEQWPRGPVDADFSAPLTSNTPVLLLSGGNDPVTPARYGEQIMAGLPQARHLVLAGQGHGQIAVGCIPRLMAEFIAAGSAATLDVECTKNVAPAPFLLSRSAPSP
jgi:pimeloyl-ACP methyl ester carboxylesterase